MIVFHQTLVALCSIRILALTGKLEEEETERGGFFVVACLVLPVRGCQGGEVGRDVGDCG
jgi:hypothetical protein